MRNICLLAALIALICTACGKDKQESSSGCSSSSARDTDDSPGESINAGGGENKRPEEKGQPAEKPEKLPELKGEELQIGKVYKSEEAINVSVYGVAFKLPKDCGTVMQKGATALTLQSTTKESLGFVFLKRDVSREEVLAELRQPQEVEDGVVLTLQGDFEEKDGYTLAKYSDSTYVGYAALHIGPDKNGILFFLGGYQKDEAHFKEVIEALGASIQLGKPLKSQTEQQWEALLSGNMLTYLNSYSSSDGLGGGVYSSTTIEIRLYPDASYSYYGNDSYSVGTSGGGGVSDGSRGAEKGTWKVDLIGTQYYLVLTHEGGKRQYKLAYDGKKTFLSGTRYFRTPIK